MTDNNEWCTIESDPAVFTELLETLECTAVELQELYTLDDSEFSEQVYGLIFLFPWQSKQPETSKTSTSNNNNTDTTTTPAETHEQLFFAHQVTTNACATQALLSVVLNTVPDLGSTLTEFKTFTQSFPPQLKGMAIAGSEVLQKAHNSFARADAFWQDPSQPRRSTGHSKEDVYHFVAYIPYQGVVYELDGLQESPVVVGHYTSEHYWWQVARQVLQTRMAAQSGQFNLMAVIPNQLHKIQQQLVADPTNELLQQQLQHQLEKRQQWKYENQRRRHNYVPLCVQLLKEMARQGSLEACVQQAKQRKQQSMQKKESTK